jgi:hypothetical protein
MPAMAVRPCPSAVRISTQEPPAPSHSPATSFSPTRPSYQLTAGGGTALASCPNTTGRGFISETPALSILLSEMDSEEGWLQFSVTASCDTTMLVNTPTTIWYFDDDSNGRLQPRLMVPNIEAFNSTQGGRLDVWLGTYEQGTSCDATLEVRGI